MPKVIFFNLGQGNESDAAPRNRKISVPLPSMDSTKDDTVFDIVAFKSVHH